MEPSDKKLFYTKVLHMNPLDAHRVLGKSPLPLLWGTLGVLRNAKNDALFTVKTVTLRNRNVRGVKTVSTVAVSLLR